MSFEATLGAIAIRMAKSHDVNAVLDEVTRGLVRDLGGAMARVWLLEGDDTLVLASSAGLSERLDGSRSRVKLGELKIGEIARTRKAVCTSDLAADARFVDKTWLTENGLVAFGGYPLEYGNRLLGVLAMFARDALPDEDFARLGVFAAQASIAIENARLVRRLEAENTYLREQAGDDTAIVGLDAVLAEARKVAPTTSSVLLLGETGTGKELFARAIHRGSPRRDRALVKVNCAALAPTLIESELFGHEKGAFTGAVARRIGRFELANGGTLFLDEVGELPLELQAKLLRVLQEHEFERVGGNKPIKVDVRIIAATNRDLKTSGFRSDLYYRLAVFPIAIPPLREHKADIPALALSFTRKAIEPDALAYLSAYDWPGNVRELHNVLERAVVLSKGDTITLADLPELAREEAPARESLKDRVQAFEKSILVDALARSGQNQSEAARLLGTSRATLQYRMRILGL